MDSSADNTIPAISLALVMLPLLNTTFVGVIVTVKLGVTVLLAVGVRVMVRLTV